MARVLAYSLLALAVTLGGCRRVEEPAGAQSSSASPLIEAAPLPSAAAPPPAVVQALKLPSSPFQALLFADEQAVELLTASAAHRLVAGKEPIERKLGLGFAATVTRHSYVFWDDGALFRAPRDAPGEPQRVTALGEAPARLVSDISEDTLAWLERLEGERVAISALVKGRPQRLYASSGSLDALLLRQGVVYFVERPASGGFRLGRVALAGGDPSFTPVKNGRWPAMLSGTQSLVYYDGTRRAVVSVSLDLEREVELARDFICSPLTAAERVYCANVSGIYELTEGRAPRPIVTGAGGVIASLAVAGDRLAFVSDAGAPGQDRLALNLVSLTEAAR